MKTLLVVLSEKCNLNCSYCGVDKWSKNKIDPDLYLTEFRKMREQYPDEKIKIEQLNKQKTQFNTTTMFKCSRCNKRNCSYFELQTRSADEPMTIFITCLDCGKKWKR